MCWRVSLHAVDHCIYRFTFRYIEGKIKGRIEVTRRRGRRRKKLLDDLGDRRGYSHLKEESFWKRLWTCRMTDYWWMNVALCCEGIRILSIASNRRRPDPSVRAAQSAPQITHLLVKCVNVTPSARQNAILWGVHISMFLINTSLNGAVSTSEWHPAVTPEETHKQKIPPITTILSDNMFHLTKHATCFGFFP
jgi:hypothetical protein